jgi:predicted MPP superfamily phosphohydrolase
MSTPEPASVQPAARRRRSPAVILARVVAYFVAAWTTIAVLAAGLFPGALWMTLAVAAYFILPLIVFLRWRGWPFYPSAAFRLLIVRPFLYANLMLPLVAGAGLIGALGGALFGHALVAGRAFAVVVLVATAIFLVIGYIGSRSLVVRHVDAFVPELPPSFDGLKIGQLSDLHVGPHTSRRFIDQVVRATHALAPDLIAITGDLIDDRAEDVAVYAELLGSLAAPLGVFMIPGNHDVYAGWDDVEEALRRAQLGTVLVNEAHIIRRGGDAIVLVGTGDPAGGRRGTSRAAPDIDRALAGVPEDATVVAFAHNPSLWPSLAKRGVALTLSGHTHWGQFALPMLGWSLASPFLSHAMGAHTSEDAVLYISPGTGYWGIPFRIGARPEVTLVTLRRATEAAAAVHRARSATRAGTKASPRAPESAATPRLYRPPRSQPSPPRPLRADS